MSRPTDTGLVFNAKLLRQRMREMGLTGPRLAVLIGANQKYVGQLESGLIAAPGFFQMLRLADVLGVRPEQLAVRQQEVEVTWTGLAWRDVGDGHGGEILRAFEGADRSIAATQTAESFAVPGEMLSWMERERLRAAGQGFSESAEFMAGYRRHAARSFEAKHAARNVGVTILRVGYLLGVSEPDWIRAVASRVGTFGSKARLVLANETQWKALDRRVRAATGAGRWHKALAVDESFAAWWTSPEHYLFTRCPACVRSVRTALEATVGPHLPTLADTQSALDRIALGKRP